MRRLVERRPVVLAAAVALFGAIFALPQATGAPADGHGLLYVIPIALVALELGVAAGLATAAGAFGLLLVWALTSNAGLAPAGFATRAAVFLAIGFLAGRFSTRMREAQVRQELLLESGLRLAHLSTRDVLPAVLVEQAMRVVGAAGARAELHGGPVAQSGGGAGRRLVLPIEARGTRFGTLEVVPGRSRDFDAEERVVLAALAVQAAVAAENQRLLELEREQAALRSELAGARRRLAEQRDRLGRVIGHQEEERRRVAEQLHEELAQALAAVLLGLGALEREAQLGGAGERLAALRAQVGSLLGDVRGLAGALRPPVLDQLGLAPALQRIARIAREREGREVTIDAAGLDVRLAPHVETAAYRFVAEALAACDGRARVRARLAADGAELIVEIHLDLDGCELDSEDLAPVRARLETLGGSLAIRAEGEATGALAARIPVIAA